MALNAFDVDAKLEKLLSSSLEKILNCNSCGSDESVIEYA